ncbi:TRP-like ion channel Pkd2 [Cymbomonas tetramitiformis]|uniref:TRP-like ion channel Pkd2 n=1 Tax=Cymbomonas tetramitiformis TaxID=36881 RepID=A0AAE0LEM1_9CHLO|nr:TRP-like ion channel Pkd2 [Cymbomonas tetramitiformis]
MNYPATSAQINLETPEEDKYNQEVYTQRFQVSPVLYRFVVDFPEPSRRRLLAKPTDFFHLGRSLLDGRSPGASTGDCQGGGGGSEEEEEEEAGEGYFERYSNVELPNDKGTTILEKVPTESMPRYVAIRNRLVGGAHLHLSLMIPSVDQCMSIADLGGVAARALAQSPETQAGLLMHLERREADPDDPKCTRRFEQIAGFCNTMPSSPRYGNDAVFMYASKLYSPHVDRKKGEYYNVTEGSDMIDPITLKPMPFAARDIRHRQTGFPLYIDGGLSEYRAGQLYAMIEDGQYIDSHTTTIQADIMTFNALSQTWGLLRLVWSRPAKGLWQVDYEVSALPVFYWTRLATLSDVLIALLHILWVAVSLSQFVLEVRLLLRTTLLGGALGLLEHFGKPEQMLALGGAFMQMVVVFLYVMYLHHMSEEYLDISAQYDVYDDLYADANFFLSAREHAASPAGDCDDESPSATCLTVADNQVSEDAAEAYAWSLPEDNSRLQQFARNLERLFGLHTLFLGFYLLQAVRTLTMILRLLLLTQQQKRLAVVLNTCKGKCFSTRFEFYPDFPEVQGAQDPYRVGQAQADETLHAALLPAGGARDSPSRLPGGGEESGVRQRPPQLSDADLVE